MLAGCVINNSRHIFFSQPCSEMKFVLEYLRFDYYAMTETSSLECLLEHSQNKKRIGNYKNCKIAAQISSIIA